MSKLTGKKTGSKAARQAAFKKQLGAKANKAKK